MFRSPRRVATLLALVCLTLPLTSCSGTEVPSSETGRTVNQSDDDHVRPPEALTRWDVAVAHASTCSRGVLQHSDLSPTASVELSTFSDDTLDPDNPILEPTDRPIIRSKKFREAFLDCFVFAYDAMGTDLRDCLELGPPNFTSKSVNAVCRDSFAMVLDIEGKTLAEY